jgi:hypothetical protein
VTAFGGTAGTFFGGRAEVNSSHWGGTAVASAVVSANAIQISGDSAAADNCESFFDGTGYAGTGNTIPTVTTCTNVTTVNGLAANVITATAIAADAIGASELAADAVAEIADAVWDEVLSGHLTSGTTGAGLNAAGSAGDPWSTSLPGAYGAGTAGYILGTNLDAAITSRLATAGYTAPLDAAGTRSAVGLASANLDTQLASAIADSSGVTTLLSRLTSTRAGYLDNLSAAPPTVSQILTTQMTESYAADGTAPTLAQALFLIQQSLHEFAISDVTRTVKRLDGTTTAATFTLDSSTAPTSTTRAS